MRYFEEMADRGGFNGKPPEGIELYREVYLRAINAIAAKRGSNVRLVPWDGNRQNWCQYSCISLEDFNNNFDNEKFKTLNNYQPAANEKDMDEAMDAAIDAAQELHLDELLMTETFIMKPELAEMLEKINA